jgi:hypothetical protein
MLRLARMYATVAAAKALAVSWLQRRHLELLLPPRVVPEALQRSPPRLEMVRVENPVGLTVCVRCCEKV